MVLKKHLTVFTTFPLFFLFFKLSLAQEIIAKKGSYGIDKKNKIIVWHLPHQGAVNIESDNFTIQFDTVFHILEKHSPFSYSIKNSFSEDAEQYHLYITSLPVINIKLDTTTLNRSSKLPGHLTYYYDDEFIESDMGIRQRGNLSLSFPKKSYDIEFRQNKASKEPRDIKFKGLRSDDDWILDGLYNEPLKLRSYVATKLWLDMHKPYYVDQEPKAKSGFDVTFVELFRNDEYLGLYALSESIDRKQLKLKRNQGDTVRGELFKANSYEGGPAFKKVGEYNNLFPHYVGFRREYPIINYQSYWNNLSKLLELVVNQSDDVFTNTIAENFDISNAIDYYILVNLLRATDNLGKNYYLGKYDQGEPYFFIPWDLDSTFGIILEGKRVSATRDLMSNGLFERLIALNPNSFKNKLKIRWNALRKTSLQTQKIIQYFEEWYTLFTNEKIYERDQKLWPKKTSDEDDYNYINQWLIDRLSFLDEYFEKL